MVVLCRRTFGDEPMASNAISELHALALSSELGRNAHVFEDDDVVHLMKNAVERTGSQRLFAKRYGLDRANLNAVLHGKRRAIGSAAKILGLRKVYVAE
jgi:hypothetical protein